ncbi:hypothetical protein CYMTET_30656, partial [Cymbomonas tetramitiformis]
MVLKPMKYLKSLRPEEVVDEAYAQAKYAPYESAFSVSTPESSPHRPLLPKENDEAGSQVLSESAKSNLSGFIANLTLGALGVGQLTLPFAVRNRRCTKSTMAELQSYSNSADVPVLEYITDNPRVHGQPMCLAGTHSLRVDKAIVAQLVGFNPENKDVPESEIFSVFLSAWITFLAKYTRNDSVAVWCGGDARETPRFGVEVAIATEISFQELVNTVSLTQSRYSPSGLESFQARFSYFPDGVAPPTVDLGQTISFELRLVLTAQPDGSCQALPGVVGEFQYCQLFDVGNVALMAAHFLHLLGALQPQAAALPLLRLPFMDGEEADLVVRQWSMHPDS